MGLIERIMEGNRRQRAILEKGRDRVSGHDSDFKDKLQEAREEKVRQFRKYGKGVRKWSDVKWPKGLKTDKQKEDYIRRGWLPDKWTDNPNWSQKQNRDAHDRYMYEVLKNEEERDIDSYNPYW